MIYWYKKGLRVAIMLLPEVDILLLISWHVPDYMHDMYSNTNNTEGVVIVTNRTTTCEGNNCQKKNYKCLNSYSISMAVHNRCNILIYDYSVEILAGKFFDSTYISVQCQSCGSSTGRILINISEI